MKHIVLILSIFLTNLLTFATEVPWDYDKHEWSELMLAIYYKNTDKYIKLVKQGVDINYVTPCTNNNYKLTAFEVALRTDNDTAVSLLLKTKKIKHPKNYIMIASAQRSSIIIDILIEYGANPNYKLQNGYSALIMATNFGSIEVLECLLKHGANVNHKEKRRIGSFTALIHATMNGDLEKIELLLKYNADKAIKDAKGLKAIDWIDRINYRSEIDEKVKSEMRNLLKCN